MDTTQQSPQIPQEVLDSIHARGVVAAQNALGDILSPLADQARAQGKELDKEVSKGASRFDIPGLLAGGALAAVGALFAPVTLPVAAIAAISAVGAVIGRVASHTAASLFIPQNPRTDELKKEISALNGRIEDMTKESNAPEVVWGAYRTEVERSALQLANAPDSPVNVNQLLQAFYGEASPGNDRRLEFSVGPEGKALKFSYDITPEVNDRSEFIHNCAILSEKQSQGKNGPAPAQEPTVSLASTANEGRSSEAPSPNLVA